MLAEELVCVYSALCAQLFAQNNFHKTPTVAARLFENLFGRCDSVRRNPRESQILVCRTKILPPINQRFCQFATFPPVDDSLT